MNFEFTAQGLTGGEKVVQRVLEIVPGAASWGIMIGMAVLARFYPLYAAVIIIAFYLYWLLKLLYMTFFLILSYLRLASERDTDWLKRARSVDRLEETLEQLEQAPRKDGLKERLSAYCYLKDLQRLRRQGERPPLFSEIYHLVIVPVAGEAKDVVEPGINSIARSVFPPERIIVILAVEERADEEVKKGAEEIREKYSSAFCDFLVEYHPDGIEGEARAKGANTTNAAKKAAEYLKGKHIPYRNVISSCFDSDTVIKPDYFAALTYYFMADPERERSSFQPVPVYNNNIWDAPGITRVLEAGSSFFQLIEATNPETLVTFSSHSMSFKALVETGYWPVDMISDDSAIFWKAFLRFDGNYKAVPMYTTVSMDAVVADNWWHTLKNVYKQKRRWAWGVENFPIVVRGFLKDRKISLTRKFKYAFKLFEGHVSWTTWAFLLTIIGWLPAFFAGKDYSHTVFYYSAPRITGTIFNLASISLLTSIALSLCLLPPMKDKKNLFRRAGYALQWLLMPFTIIFFSALPALDAQTRLMLGKYMTFWVTEKGRGSGRSAEGREPDTLTR
ncbi:MAG: glycosyltransferase [Candidatus Omnitrophica bacterium]|nr:glycosyltransferase [Candidatus Omnitrophota bacterium]